LLPMKSITWAGRISVFSSSSTGSISGGNSRRLSITGSTPIKPFGLSTYFQVLLFAGIVPLIAGFHPRLAFYRSWKYAFPAILVTALLFLAWDAEYTRIGVWGFSAPHLQGIYLFRLPLEECLFFIVIPYCSIFTYEVLNGFSTAKWFSRHASKISILIALFTLLPAIFFFPRLYTAVNFLLATLLVILFSFILHVSWLGKFYRAYLVLLVPFFLVNGVLTGTGIHGAVVWYNNAENMGIRILTIPVEDLIYGFNLILINVSLYEYFKKKY